MLNIEKYKDEIKAELEKYKTLGCVVNKLMGNTCDDYPKCNDCYLKVLDWLLEEYKEPILNEEEKKILNDLIEVNKKLTNSKFLYVTKLFTNNNNYCKCYLYLTFENCNICDTVAFYSDTIFKRMETNKQYSLEELGLCKQQ